MEIMENPAIIDRISNLPNDILCHILSLLPTKLAFTTSVLSKRWASLWWLCGVASIDDEVVKDKDKDSFNRLFHFVDKFILFPKEPNLTIKTFHLKCSSRYWYDYYFKINQWIEIAKQRHLEDFNLHLSEYKPNNFALTPNIFNIQTLVILKLINVCVEGNISCVKLPLLKTLHLKHVILKDPEDLKSLINGCTLLEDLHTNGIMCYQNIGRTNGFLWYREDIGSKPQGFQTLSKLVKANINSFDLPFRAISSVQRLRIVKLKERKDYGETDSYYNALPIFRNLTHLEILFYEFRHGWDDILEMLQHCPKLQDLSIIKGEELNKRPYENWKCSNFVPECIGSHLRSCSITSSCFLVDDLRFAAYILQNAKLLRALKIHSYDESLNSLQKEQQFADELSSFSKISLKCELSLKFSSYLSYISSLNILKILKITARHFFKVDSYYEREYVVY